MEAERDDLMQAKEAFVELELMGVEFTLNGGDIDYRASPDLERYLGLVNNRLSLVQAHKEAIKAWLPVRTKEEVDECADRITERVSNRITNSRLIRDHYERQAHTWVDHLEVLEANFEKVRNSAKN
jgi:hypothetical protein